MNHDPLLGGGLCHAVRQTRADRMRHRDMGHTACPEETRLPLDRAIHKLIDKHDRTRRQMLAKRSASRQRDQIRDTGLLQNIDIGAVVDIGGRQSMPLAMARQKDKLRVADPSPFERG